MSRKTFFILGIITLVGFTFLGWLLVEQFQDRRFVTVFEGEAIYIQIFAGIFYGSIVSLIAWNIVMRNFMTPARNHFAGLIRELELNSKEILFISFCAGVGEEVLFRGAIQPWLGIWITAVVFVALHGYLNPMNWRISIYGFVMCLFMAGLGYLCEYAGLISSIVAHIVIDAILLKKLNDYHLPRFQL